MNIINPENGEIKARYNQLAIIRDPFLTRGYKYSLITVPSLLPENDESSNEVLIDYASVGTEYVNHLSNTYLDEMFPAHRSFFKLQMPIDKLKSAAESGGKTTAEFEKLFAATEKEARWKFEGKHTRVALLDHIKQLIVTGNSCLYLLPDKELAQNYAMDEYVVWRDQSGKLLELITVDKKKLMSLDTELRTEIMATLDDINADTDLMEYTVDIYTYIRRNPERDTEFITSQAVESTNIGDAQTYPAHLLPWVPTYWNRTRREVWGRGLVEDHYGAFFAMSILVEALVTAGAISTDFKFLVKPGSMVDVVELNNSASGTYHYGNPDDVAAVETGKRTELNFVMSLVDMYRKQLGKIFLVLSSQMRDAERVTADENRLRAQELNKAHGGVFGNLALTLQKPTAALILRDLNIIVEGTDIEPVIMTGLDAMGRASENEKILYFFNDAAALNNVPEDVRAAFKVSDLLTILGTGRDIETSFIMTADELQAEQQRRQEAEAQRMAGESMVDKATPEQIAEGMSEQQG